MLPHCTNLGVIKFKIFSLLQLGHPTRALASPKTLFLIYIDYLIRCDLNGRITDNIGLFCFAIFL